MNIKKIIAVILAAAAVMSLLCSCKKEEDAPDDEYNGVLSKVRLGMPMKKIIALNSGAELYYENDTTIWCVNTDTDLMELRDRLPADNQYYYADDSLITYTFKQNKEEEESYLTSYLEETLCKLDRETAEKYYEDKKAALIKKYKPPAEEAVFSATIGTEDVDQVLEKMTVMTMSSFDVTFTMRLTYDTVDGVDGYYGSYYSIEVKELPTKTPVQDKDKKDEKSKE